MSFFKTTSHEVLRARYNSLLEDVPVAIFTAISALSIQMIVLNSQVHWSLSIATPLLRMLIGCSLLLYWFWHRDERPSIDKIRKRLEIASIVFILAGFFTFWRSVYLYPLTDTFGHYFLIFHNTLYGFCFAFILSKLGPAAYAYNLLMISSAIACIYRGDFEHPHLMTMLILVFEVGMLITMRGSTSMFDKWVNATYETQALLKDNQRLANQDVLTQLPNRRQFFVQVEQQLVLARQTDECFAVGILDLDNFKPVNDVHGHHIGDLVLIEVGKRLAQVRPEQVRFYRLGGDEFAFHLVTDDEHASLKQVAHDINQAISQPISIDGLLITVKASIGACIICEDNISAQSLYEHADFALYHVKRTGRGNLEIYSKTLEQERMHLNRIDQALRTADIHAELYPVFQPIIDMDANEVCAFESLARWQSPTIGPVSPAMFIPVAESLGMIADITKLMFSRSMIEMATWPDNMRLSFNLSAYDVTNQSVIKALIGMMHTSQLAPDRFMFEITETALLQNFETARDNIGLLRKAGAKVALDDFGTGYSSLSHVQNLPLDKLKIDRSFVKDIETNTTSQTIVRSILALCHGMHMECVAEGAETESQVRFLQAMGCQLIQGYYFAKPMPKELVQAYLADTKLIPAT
ncbi:bifunctional diguanylate cyclase/phosphodiesterase [Methylophilus sp. 14]|uniref:putative bifunctional diguanylate cyclase/phosphodiesterase n=1 Tax=Methylophilus sp. 14 TaxID=2781019 RepID=UPI00188F844C|nr:EAL domain-containing protein [Methylophilus sp. 14]MBF4987109.1 EAL domain-containing protein [Methylophilus sp. 14]